MSPLLKSYLVIPGAILLGLGLLGLCQQLPLPGWLNTAVVIFIAFVLLNVAFSLVFKLNAERKEFWGLQKLPYLLWGILGGLAISMLPLVISFLTGRVPFEEVHINLTVSLASLGLTLVIVSWEELWFRGLFLNYCLRHVSAIRLSLIIGFLFMLLHLLNPEIQLMRQGPGLFFAGALLTILYFYYKTIWLPIGLHFGNNFFGSSIGAGLQHDPFFGEDGYLGALILAGLFLLFVFKTQKKEKLHRQTDKG